MKLITSYIFLSAAFLLAFSGCKKEYETIEQLDEQNIQAYLTQKNLDMELDSEGFYYHIIEQGSGSAVDYTDKVFVTFTMTSLDDKYTSTDEYVINRYSSYLGYLDREHSGMPAAFREAVEKLNKGGSIRVVIPSRLAYGRNGFNKIPGNASLDCTLILYDVE